MSEPSRITIDKQSKIDRARELFLQGYNCAQAVFAAYAPEMGLPEQTALRIASGFGGGMGGLRGVCGSLSGMYMALSCLRGYDKAEDKDGKKALYATVQELNARFLEQFEATHCKQLLLNNGVFVSNLPSDRTPEYYKQRPCVRFIEWTAGALADELNR